MSDGKGARRLPLGKLAVEFAVIVIGVLVALAVDQWNEGRENDRLAHEVLRTLATEITENRRQIARRIEYHASVLPGLDSLQRLAESGTRTNILRSGALPEGIGFWLLRDTAWETAIVTEAVRHFDLGVTSLLSLTYSLQEGIGSDAIESPVEVSSRSAAHPREPRREDGLAATEGARVC